MSYVDIILGIPLAWAVYKGFKKGLILELAMLLGLMVGLYAGLHFSKMAAGLIRDTFQVHGEWLPVASFIIVFILVLLGVYLLGKLLENVAKAMMLGLLNRIGGAVFGAIKMALILSFILLILNGISPRGRLFPVDQQEKSILYKSVSSLAPLFMPKLKDIPEEARKLDII